MVHQFLGGECRCATRDNNPCMYQRTFRLFTILDIIRFRFIPLLFFLFVISQVIIFGLVLPKKCNYLMWLIGQCTESNVLYLSLDPHNSIGGTKSKPLCPLISPNLAGAFEVIVDIPSWEELERKYHTLRDGGRQQPSVCQSRHRVAIIIPFRDRDIHLKILLNNIHAMLQRQQLDYGLFVIDMAKSIPFNRALLLNVGFLEASKEYPYQCFIFHDVDLIPNNDHNLYSCPEHPRHMSVAIDIYNYKLPYTSIFGGVVAMSREHMLMVNGFSNKFFGWGGEDDDMFGRIRSRNMTITRYTGDVARYHMLTHRKDKGNPNRFHLLKSGIERSPVDGLNSLTYKVLKKEKRKLYTYISVSVNQSEIMSIGVNIAESKNSQGSERDKK